MVFTVHPDQRPSDPEELWIRRIADRNKAAEIGCKLHALNVRTAIALEKKDQ